MQENMKIKSSVLCMIASAFIAGGCATDLTVKMYDGPVRMNDRITVLTLPSEIEIVLIDGLSVGNKTARSRGVERTIEMLPGTHYFEVKYYKLWKKSALDTKGELIISRPQLLTLTGKAGLSYRIYTPTLPADLSDAKKLEDDPHLKIDRDTPSVSKKIKAEEAIVKKTPVTVKKKKIEPEPEPEPEPVDEKPPVKKRAIGTM